MGSKKAPPCDYASSGPRRSSISAAAAAVAAAATAKRQGRQQQQKRRQPHGLHLEMGRGCRVRLGTPCGNIGYVWERARPMLLATLVRRTSCPTARAPTCQQQLPSSFLLVRAQLLRVEQLRRWKSKMSDCYLKQGAGGSKIACFGSRTCFLR